MNEVQTFVLEDSGIRGALVRLEETWQQVIAAHEYPPAIRTLLGEGVVSTVLLASGLKTTPSVSLQLQGEGPLKLLLIQCTDGQRVRGMASFKTGAENAPLLGEGKLVVNLDTGKPNGLFQGIVPLTSTKLEECLESYFERSEQLDTRLVLRNDEQRVAGLLLQVLPGHGEERAAGAFETAAACAATVSAEELTGLDGRRPPAEAVRRAVDSPVRGAARRARLPLHARAPRRRRPDAWARRGQEPARRARSRRAQVRVLQPRIPL